MKLVIGVLGIAVWDMKHLFCKQTERLSCKLSLSLGGKLHVIVLNRKSKEWFIDRLRLWIWCTKGIQGQSLIDTLDRDSIDISINT